jgi:hypothetical protein
MKDFQKEYYNLLKDQSETTRLILLAQIKAHFSGQIKIDMYGVFTSLGIKKECMGLLYQVGCMVDLGIK